MPVEMNLGGYAVERNVLAQQYKRGNQNVYLIALPLNLIEVYLPIPDPSLPFEGNRRVNLSRAIKFGEYWRHNTEWVAPPLLVDTTYKLSESFKAEFTSGGISLGVLSLPQDSKHQLKILDGQHRILGIQSAQQRLYEEKNLYTESLAKQESPVTREKLANIESILERLKSECITLEIIEGISPETHKQFFHDIAVNAKGINKAVVAGMDQKSISNRVAVSLIENHSLLAGNTDVESDRVAGANSNFVSLKTVKDIVNEVVCGITKSITPAQAKQLDDTNLESIVTAFFDSLLLSFKELDDLAGGELEATELREKSLLGSATILRHLSNAFGALAVDKSDLSAITISIPGLEKCKNLYKELSKNMAIPVDSKWYKTGYFPQGAKAPGSRTQELKGLSELIVKWGESGKYWTS